MSDLQEHGSGQVVVSAEHLRKRYGGVEALRDVTFSVHAGQVLGLLGPNGAGKSTTISLILGLAVPTSGAVNIFGGPPHKVQNRSRIGYLPESPIFPDYHSALSVLNFHAALVGIPPSERADRVASALEHAGLAQAAKRRVRTLSKGMLQRLGLAVALMGEPEFLVLDEPTSNLDPVGRRELCDMILAQRERGCAVMFASHVLAEIEATCDRIVILNRGQVVCFGSAAELRGPEGRTLDDVFFDAVGATQRGEA